MALTRAKLEELIDNGDIDVGGGGFNPNLLHNWDFRNPINQRGVSGAISSGSYFYDRWIRNSGTVTVNAGYLTLASGAVVEQRIEGNLLAGLVCTVSFEVGGTIYHGSGAFPTNNGTVSVEVDGYPDITFGCATGYMFVLIPAASETSVKRFKCEMGFVSTLHLDPPMDKAKELSVCRYYLNTFVQPQLIYGYFWTSGLLRMFAAIPIMRVAPTVSEMPTLQVFHAGSAITGVATSATYRGTEMQFDITGLTGVPNFTSVIGRFQNTSPIYLSADL